MRYKIGDKVRVKKNINIQDIGRFGFAPAMERFCDKECRVTVVVENSMFGPHYLLDNTTWMFAEEWLEDIYPDIPEIEESEIVKMFV